jgi:hypothetical protein
MNAVENFRHLLSERGADVSQNKNPRRFAAGSFVHQTAAARSGIEIAVDAEAELPVVDV